MRASSTGDGERGEEVLHHYQPRTKEALILDSRGEEYDNIYRETKAHVSPVRPVVKPLLQWQPLHNSTLKDPERSGKSRKTPVVVLSRGRNISDTLK